MHIIARFVCIVKKNITKSLISTIVYFRIPRFKQKRNMLCIFLFWCTQRDFVEPRRKNSPPDYFYLRFGWPLSSSKLGNLLFESLVLNRKGICFAYSFLVHPEGFEPPIFRFVAERSIQLSHGCLHLIYYNLSSLICQ